LGDESQWFPALPMLIMVMVTALQSDTSQIRPPCHTFCLRRKA